MKKEKTSKLEAGLSQSILTSAPKEVVCSKELFHLDQGGEGFEYLLLVPDHFSRFTQDYPIRSKRAAAQQNVSSMTSC